jgi:hypothetical protein
VHGNRASLTLVACSAAKAPARSPAANATPSSPRCTVDASYLTDSQPIDPRAPIVVVFGYNGWGGGADRPAIAVWPDGQVLVDGKVGRVPAADAAAIAHDVAERLHDQPPRVSLTDAFDTPSTLIAARDGLHWRVVHVEGFTLRGVRGLASVRAANARPDRGPPDAIVGALDAAFALDRVSLPDAYLPEQIVVVGERIPPGTAFADEWPGAAIDWPRELPDPPAARGSGDDATFELVVPGRLLPDVERLQAVMRNGNRPVRIRGGRWMFYVAEVFRGREAVQRALECADSEYVRRWNAEHGDE